jgi:hypothetical protein
MVADYINTKNLFRHINQRMADSLSQCLLRPASLDNPVEAGHCMSALFFSTEYINNFNLEFFMLIL